MRKHLFTAIALLFAGNAAASEFLPLNVGDVANYTNTQGGTRQISVDDSAGSWRHMQGSPLPGSGWFASALTDTRAYAYNEDTAASVLLADFARTAGTRFSLALGGCNNSAVIGAKNLSLSVPAGSFQRVTRLDFGRNCADAGLISAWFAPNVGLVKWTESNIAGAQEYSLQHARIAGIALGQQAAAAGGVRISALLPGPRVMVNVTPRVSASLKIENSGTQEQVFTCPSTQQFEITLRDAAGEVVNAWSATRRFAQLVTTFSVAPGASKEIGGEIDLTSLATNAPLDIGSYSIGIELRCQMEQQASAFLPVPSYSVQGPIFVDQRVGHF
jgi:Intracellular proteinase inhibitor